MFILKKGHQPGVYVPLRALFLVLYWNFVLSTDEPILIYKLCHLIILIVLYMCKCI